VGCGAFGPVLCDVCEERLEPATGAGRCAHCAAAWDGEHFCPRCVNWRYLDGARAAVEMAGPGRALVHALKYRGVMDAAPVMGRLMLPLWDALDCDVAIGVPLHPSRLRRRGFNQSTLLIDAAGWPRAKGRLVRQRKTRTQVGLDAAARKVNVAGAFVYAGVPLTALAIALVDDVVTSGSTVDECARVLKEHGARRVVAVSFARTSQSLPGGRYRE
jgi:ComF family protein